MPVPCGVLVDRVLQRVRDEHAAGNPRPFVREVLTGTQRLLNAKMGLVIGDIAFPTVAYQQVYPIVRIAEAAMRIVGVLQDGRDLSEVQWREFWWRRGPWLRDVGERLESFALIGRDMLVLYPAQRLNGEVTLRAAVRTTTLESDQTLIQIPEDFHPLLVDLTSAVLLLKMRTYATLDDLNKSIQARLTPAMTP